MTYVLILIGHFVGDFLLQPARLAELKRKNIGYLLLHTVIYMVPVTIATAFFGNWEVIIALPVIAVSHFFIDFIKNKLQNKYCSPGAELVLYLADQLIHILILLIAAHIFRNNLTASVEYIILCAIICTKPASVLVKHVLNALSCKINLSRGEECDSEEAKGNAGAVIGVLERLIMLVLGIMNLYSAIGLVFTAKSLARFKKFEERDFAEKYLVGTLLSMFIVILLLFIPVLLSLPFNFRI